MSSKQCKFCRHDGRLTNDALKSAFHLAGGIPPYFEGRLKENEAMCNECATIMEESFVKYMDKKDLPLHVNRLFLFKSSTKKYLKRLKSAQI